MLEINKSLTFFLLKLSYLCFMKNILILLMVSCLLVSSCATRKYGCGLTSVKSYIGINPNYVPARKSICRGHGRVSPVSEGVYMITLDGVLIKDDTTIADAKYVLAYGNFSKALQAHNGKTIYFECKTVFPNIYMPSEIIEVVEGCIDNRNTESNGTIVFNKI